MRRFHFGLLPLLTLVSSLASAQVPRYGHVVVVTLENHSYEQVIGNSQMPYYNQLASKYALATQYYSTQHNSLSALMWLTAGAQVTTNDSDTRTFNVDHIARELHAAGKTWKAYAQSLPYPGFTDYSSANAYLKRHVPFTYFADVVGSQQKMNIVPLQPYFEQDIASGTLPNFSYVVPDADEDAHDGTLAQADQWLQANIPQLLASPQFQKDGLLVLVWDEGNLNPLDERRVGGRTATVFIGKGVRAAFHSTTPFSHIDLLRTICAAEGLSSCPNDGARGALMSEMFQRSTTSPHIDVISPTLDTGAGRNPTRIVADVVDAVGASAMIVYADGREAYRTYSAHTDFSLDLPPAQHHIQINAWDTSGRLLQASMTLTVLDNGVVRPCLVNAANRTITICAPLNNTNVSGALRVVAEAQDYDAQIRVARILLDGKEAYRTYSGHIDADLAAGIGWHQVQIDAWDIKGNYLTSTAHVDSSGASTISSASTTAPAVEIATPFNGTSSSSPMHLAARLESTHAGSAMIVYSDNQEIYRTYSGSFDTYLQFATGAHYVVVKAWDTAGNLSTSDGVVNISTMLEDCDTDKPGTSVTICSDANNIVAGATLHFVAEARSDFNTIPLTILYADGKEVYRTYGGYMDTQLKLSSGGHSLHVNSWNSKGVPMQASQTVTIY